MFDKLTEASEKLDELSKGKLENYIDKVKGDKRKGNFTDPKHIYRAGDKLNKGFSKIHATEEVVVEPTIEEAAAQLDEVSKETLRSYIGKASDSVSGRGRKSVKKVKRVNHIDAAKEKLSKIINKEYEKSEAVHKTKIAAVHDHFQKEAPKILATHGFEKLHSANDRTNYHKGHENGHSTIVSIHHKPNDSEYGQDYGSKFHIHSTNGSGTHMGHNHHVTRAGSTEDHKIRVVHGFHDSLIRAVDSAKSDRY